MKRKTTPLSALLLTGLFLGVASAQQSPPPLQPPNDAPPPAAASAPAPPPPPAPPARPRPRSAPLPPLSPASAVTRQGTIKSFNLAPTGEINGFVLRDGTAVMLPPPAAAQLRALAREGAHVTVSGISRPSPSGTALVDAQVLTVNGQTITIAAPPLPPPAPAKNRIQPLAPRVPVAPPPPPPRI